MDGGKNAMTKLFPHIKFSQLSPERPANSGWTIPIIWRSTIFDPATTTTLNFVRVFCRLLKIDCECNSNHTTRWKCLLAKFNVEWKIFCTIFPVQARASSLSTQLRPDTHVTALANYSTAAAPAEREPRFRCFSLCEPLDWSRKIRSNRTRIPYDLKV